METNQFTLEELEKMLSDHIVYHLEQHGNVSEQNGKALLQNTINISKQLFSILKTETREKAKPDHVSADELETMIVDYETYWNDRLGRGDVEAEMADMLPGRIVWTTSQLIEMMKQ